MPEAGVPEGGSALSFSRFSGMYNYETMSDVDDDYELPYSDNVEDNLDNGYEEYESETEYDSSIYTATDDESDLDQYDENGSVIVVGSEEDEDEDSDEDEGDDLAHISSGLNDSQSDASGDGHESGVSEEEAEDEDGEDEHDVYEDSQEDIRADHAYESDVSAAVRWLDILDSRHSTSHLASDGEAYSANSDYLFDADAESEHETYSSNEHTAADYDGPRDDGYFDSQGRFNYWRESAMFADFLSGSAWTDTTSTDPDTDDSFYGLY